MTLPEKNLNIVKSEQLIKQTGNSSSYVQEVAFEIKADKGVLLLLFKKIFKLLFGGAIKNFSFQNHRKKSLQPRTKVLRHFNAVFNFAPCNHRVQKKQIRPPHHPWCNVVLTYNSPSVHFFCYRKQHCNRGGGKRSFKLRL